MVHPTHTSVPRLYRLPSATNCALPLSTVPYTPGHIHKSLPLGGFVTRCAHRSDLFCLAPRMCPQVRTLGRMPKYEAVKVYWGNVRHSNMQHTCNKWCYSDCHSWPQKCGRVPASCARIPCPNIHFWIPCPNIPPTFTHRH